MATSAAGRKMLMDLGHWNDKLEQQYQSRLSGGSTTTQPKPTTTPTSKPATQPSPSTGRPTNPYQGNNDSRYVGFIDPSDGDTRTVHANQRRIDEYLAKGERMYQGDTTDLYDYAKKGYGNDKMFKDALTGYGSNNTDPAQEAKDRLAQWDAWQEYAKPVSGATPLSTGGSSGYNDFASKYSQFKGDFDLRKMYDKPSDQFLAAVNGMSMGDYAKAYDQANRDTLGDKAYAQSTSYRNNDSYKDFMDKYSHLANKYDLDYQYNNPSGAFLGEINSMTEDQYGQVFDQIDKLVRNGTKEQYAKFKDTLDNMSGDYASRFDQIQAALQSAQGNWSDFQNTSNQRYDELSNSISDLKGMFEQFNQPIDFDKFKTELATIDDLANKYGFDYSKDYAKRQAELERQQKQNAIDTQKKSVDNSVRSSAQGLDHDYFQRYMNQAQGQTNSGLNGGIASDQNLRLAMSRQNAMGDIYRDANLQNFELGQAEGLLGAEELARADQLYNDRRQQGFQNVLQEGQFNQRQNLASLQAELSRRGQDIDLSKYLNSFNNLSASQQQQQSNWDKQFNWQQQMDQWNQQYQEGKMSWSQYMDKVQQGNWQQQFGWNQYMDQSGLDMKQGQIDWSQYKDLWNMSNTERQQKFHNDLAVAKFNRPYEQLTAYEQQQLSQSQQRIAQGYAQMNQNASEFAQRLAQSDDHFDKQIALQFQEIQGMLKLNGYEQEEAEQMAGDITFGGGNTAEKVFK